MVEGVVHGVQAVGWVACSDFHLRRDKFIEAKNPCPENSTFACCWQRVLFYLIEVARASSSYCRCTLAGSWFSETCRL